MSLAHALADLAATPMAYALAFVIGTLFGSFGNVCIYRLPPTDEHPHGRSIVSPGSHCGACAAPVRWYDNLPILSYLWLRGRCRSCKTRFSPRYLLVELLTGALFAVTYHVIVAVAYAHEPVEIQLGRFAVYALFVFALVVIAFIDLDHRLVLDQITFVAIPAFYALGLTLPERSWSDGLIGAAVGYGIVRLVSDGWYAATGRDALGYGDGKLLAMVGALLGWRAVVTALFTGSVLGSIIGVGYVLYRRRRAAPAPPTATPAEPIPLRYEQLPFGPFLAAGAAAYLYAEGWVRVTFDMIWG
jgi:leader peptidase (prepilin peptidase)/N-methyltransferase